MAGKTAPATLGTTSAIEDSLERIMALMDEKGYARVVDIAARLNISQASVTNMLQKLDAEGLIKYEKYRGLVLTPSGLSVAQTIARRHELLEEFLTLLGVSPSVIAHDVEGMEHHISPETLEAIQRLTEYLHSHPEITTAIQKPCAD
jgi:Mn-dependent DtxR family transcriptional regulator